MASTPPFEAVYEICEVAEPITATNEAVLMMDPLCCATMCLSAAREHRYTLFRFTSCTRSHAGSSVVSMESSSGGEIPALLNAMSRPPYTSTAAAYIAWTSCSCVTSARTNRPSTAEAAALPATSSMSAQTTRAPSSAKRRAVARPMPLPAPVTTATRSCRRADTLSPQLWVAMKTFLTSVNA